jgi:DNA-binding NarL/FixJ family response regulator
MISGSGSGFSLDEFCRNFDISARERDIIREVCQGLSNQQIADKLFITLQTVKDHTSRIYDKTNCNSRAQLITMVKK